MKIKKIRHQYVIIFSDDDLQEIEDCMVDYKIQTLDGEEYVEKPEPGCEVLIRHPTIGAIILRGRYLR